VVLCSLGLFLSVGYSVISVISPAPITTTTTGGPYTPPPEPEIAKEWVADGKITLGEYTKTLSPGGSYQLHWTNDEEYIYVGIKVATTGWVALGIQPDLRSEKNIDMILGFVRGGEKITIIYDMFSAVQPGLYVQDLVLGGFNDVVEFGGAEGAETEAAAADDQQLLFTLQ